MSTLKSFAEPFTPLPEAARQHSIEATLAARGEPGAELWIFGYGGLMWNPDFPHLSAKPARLQGWRRQMCVWTALARGTPELPGLSLGLVPGGHCSGIAFQIAAEMQGQALAIIWHRELWTDIYQPTWVDLDTNGEALPAIAFTANPASRQFAAGLTEAEIVAHIARASGERGRCSDYLSKTVQELRRLGIRDGCLERLEASVSARLRRKS